MAEGGQQFGKYRIIQELGAGGFATVYKALDTTLDREVALKILDPLILRDPPFINRFKQEAKVMARLFHPNVATVFEISEAAGRHFIAMQYIQGRNLRDLIREESPLPFDEMASIIEQIGDTLKKLKDEGFGHDYSREVQNAVKVLKAEGKLAILLVEQFVDFCRDVADRFYAMDRGAVVVSGAIALLTDDVVKEHLQV